jgi:hypothetical protein
MSQERDREHIVQLNCKEREDLIKWLNHPSGAHLDGRATFEAVQGGGILVRTQPYSYNEHFTNQRSIS